MLTENKFFDKRFLSAVIYVLLLIFLAFLAVESYSNLNKNSEGYTAAAIDMIDQRMMSLFFEMNSFPRYAGNDVLFLSRLSSMEKVINSGETELKIQNIKDLENDFIEFLKENTAYYQLRYIDEEGNELLKVDFDGDNYRAISEDRLQNQKESYYFKGAMNLDKGEVFVSRLDLDIEDGKLRNAGTEEHPEYVPVIRYATPVFNSEGDRKGIVVSNVHADYFLEDIRRFQREEETAVLIDSEGFYLAHPDREKEFAFMTGREDNFYKDYPEVSEEILSSPTKRSIESENLVFSFRYIHPTAGSFEVHKGSEKIFGEGHEKGFFWVLISISDKGDIDKNLENLKRRHLVVSLFSGAIVLTIAILVFVLAFKVPNNKFSKGGGR